MHGNTVWTNSWNRNPLYSNIISIGRWANSSLFMGWYPYCYYYCCIYCYCFKCLNYLCTVWLAAISSSLFASLPSNNWSKNLQLSNPNVEVEGFPAIVEQLLYYFESIFPGASKVALTLDVTTKRRVIHVKCVSDVFAQEFSWSVSWCRKSLFQWSHVLWLSC